MEATWQPNTGITGRSGWRRGELEFEAMIRQLDSAVRHDVLDTWHCVTIGIVYIALFFVCIYAYGYIGGALA